MISIEHQGLRYISLLPKGWLWTDHFKTDTVLNRFGVIISKLKNNNIEYGIYMARPQKYDRHKVLVSALKLFWEQGFHTTSLPQLLAVTELSSSSFYSAFGDKRTLFIECFKLYAASIDKVLTKVRSCINPADAVYHYFARTLFPPADHRAQNGCLVINTLIEFEGGDKEIFALAQKQLADTDSAFAECFSRAQREGRLSADLELDEIIAMINTLGAGVQVRRRGGLGKAEIKFILDGFIRAIGAEPIPFSKFSDIEIKRHETA